MTSVSSSSVITAEFIAGACSLSRISSRGTSDPTILKYVAGSSVRTFAIASAPYSAKSLAMVSKKRSVSLLRDPLGRPPPLFPVRKRPRSSRSLVVTITFDGCCLFWLGSVRAHPSFSTVSCGIGHLYLVVPGASLRHSPPPYIRVVVAQLILTCASLCAAPLLAVEQVAFSQSPTSTKSRGLRCLSGLATTISAPSLIHVLINDLSFDLCGIFSGSRFNTLRIG